MLPLSFILGNLDSSKENAVDFSNENKINVDVDSLSPLDSLMIYRLETFIQETAIAYENFNYSSWKN